MTKPGRCRLRPIFTGIDVLDGGQITERGRHDDLMDVGGTYARLFTLQSRGYR